MIQFVSYVVIAVLLILAVVLAIALIRLENKIVTLEDKAPSKDKYNGLVFQNEIQNFIEKKDGKLYLKVVNDKRK